MSCEHEKRKKLPGLLKKPGVGKRNETERNGKNGKFSETKRNGKNLQDQETKRNETESHRKRNET
jgi:hypothetical protein